MSTSMLAEDPIALGHQRQHLNEQVYLIGRPPISEYTNLLLAQSPDGQIYDQSELAEEWRLANDHIRDLEALEAGYADYPVIGSLARTLESLREQILADPMFHRSFGMLPTEIAMVELDRLVVVQKQIGLGSVAEFRQQLGTEPDDEAIFRLCIPPDHPHPQARSLRINNNSYVFVSPSPDFRFVEPVLLEPGQISGYYPVGPISSIVGLVIGYGCNFFNVLHVENRLILNNGNHRAFALREMGFTHAPCVLQHVSRREELPLAAHPELIKNPDLYLTAARPALFKDYFDLRLRKILPARRRLRQIKITFGVEVIDTPDT